MRTLKCLYQIKVLTPIGFWWIIAGFFREGKTMNLLLYFCAKMYPERTALVQGDMRINYRQFYSMSLNLASNLAVNYKLNHGDRVALMSKNSWETTVALFALSRTGVQIYLLNPEMSDRQFVTLCSQRKFDFVISDQEKKEIVLKSLPSSKTLVMNGNEPNSIQKLIDQPAISILRKRKAGNIVVLTGGTTGDFKSASRKQSISDFLNPLVALIDQMQLHQFQSVYIPTPIYHGYGLASLVVSVLLGSEIHLTKEFNAKEGCNLIQQNSIEVVTLVPIMLIRMLNENPQSLASLNRILSGGAPLNPGLIVETEKMLGSRLYNLYGTTEAGFCVLGTPEDLKRHPNAIGRAIKGVKIRVNSDQAIGMLAVKSQWVMRSQRNKWVETGDLASIDASKLIFLKGRSDSMILSGGENVYPKDLEDALSIHPQIETAAVIGVVDSEFGSRLKAFVCLKSKQSLTEVELMNWLKTNVARYQMPVSIEFLGEMPLTSVGKINKKGLLEN